MNGQMLWRREGDWLVGVLEFQLADGRTQRIEGRANLRQIIAEIAPMLCRGCGPQLAAAAGGDVVAVGFFGKLIKKIGKAAKKIGRGKIFKTIGKGLKGVAKYAKKGLNLPGIKQAVTLAAAAYPPLGVPAMAAFHGANAALAAAEKGPAQARQFAGTLKKLQRVAKGRGAGAVKARKALKVLQVTNKWRRGLHAAQRRATHMAVRGLELPPAPISLNGRGC